MKAITIKMLIGVFVFLINGQITAQNFGHLKFDPSDLKVKTTYNSNDPQRVYWNEGVKNGSLRIKKFDVWNTAYPIELYSSEQEVINQARNCNSIWNNTGCISTQENEEYPSCPIKFSNDPIIFSTSDEKGFTAFAVSEIILPNNDKKYFLEEANSDSKTIYSQTAILLNSTATRNFTWSINLTQPPNSNVTPMKPILLHEFGHLIGLGHHYPVVNDPTVMSYPAWTNPYVFNLTSYDVEHVDEICSFNGTPTGIEDYIWVYADHPEIPFNVNQIYYEAVHANFVDEYPYGDYIVQWGSWQVKALSTCGEILVYESPNNGTSYINIPPLPNYEWIRDGNNNVAAKVITSGVDNNGYYHQNFADIKIGNVPNTFITSGELTSDTYWCGDLTITGDITVPRDVTLTIMPGAEITFANNSSLIVDGTLNANGISYSQINFNFISPDYEYENGIKINQDGTANISYTAIDNAYIGITINETNADVNNCEISNCGRGIYLYRTNYANEDSWLMDNKMRDCYWYGISMYQSSPYIIGNELYDNGMALFCDQYSSPYLGYAETYGNNYIHNNSIGLFANFSSNPFLGRTGCIAFGSNNSFVNQTSYHIEALNYCEILAENNWWDSFAGKFYSYNSNIDYEPYLESPPFNNMNNMKNSPEELAFDSKFAQRGFDSKVTTEEKELGFQNDWCIKWKLLYARNLIEVKKYKQAQKICKDVIEEYPDSSLTHYAVDLLWQASRRGDNDSLKGFFKKLSNKKAKKKLYASAEKILAGFERNLRIENLDRIISKYSGEPVLEAVMFDKFIYYFNEQKNKQLARYMSAQLDSLFPGSHSAEEAHRFLGDTQPGGNILSKANLGAENTVVTGADNLPKEYELRGHYPNPFNPSTTISYGLPEESKVQITVYDILGTRVTELVNENQSAGYYNVTFNARNLSSGIYIYRFTAVKPNGKYFERVSKLMLMK